MWSTSLTGLFTRTFHRNLKCRKLYIYIPSLRLLFYYIKYIAFSPFRVTTNYFIYIIAFNLFPISSRYCLSCSYTYLIRNYLTIILNIKRCVLLHTFLYFVKLWNHPPLNYERLTFPSTLYYSAEPRPKLLCDTYSAAALFWVSNHYIYNLTIVNTVHYPQVSLFRSCRTFHSTLAMWLTSLH